MASQAIAPRSDTANNPIALFQSQLETRARDIQAALPAHIAPEKFQRTIMTAVAQNPDLLRADRQSLILACYKAAQDALLPDGREAALVTFNTRQKDAQTGQWGTVKLVQYMPMAFGLRKKILQSGLVTALEVNVVYRSEVEKGTFLYEVGLEPPLRHRPSLDLTEEETTDDQIVAAYSIATMKDGTKSYEVMRRFEINKVRQASQTGATTDRNGQPREAKGPWVDWFAEMAKKTVMRRHAKTLPMSGDLLIDIEGRELEMRGAVTALGVTPDAPQLEDRTEEDPPHDELTGELQEEPAVDEEAAGPQSIADDLAAGPGPSDEPDTNTNDAATEKTAAEEEVDKVIAKLEAAKTAKAVEKVIEETKPHMVFMPDELQMQLERAFDANRKRFEQAPAQESAE